MSIGDTTSAELERIAAIIVDAIFKVHMGLGAGLLESAYVRVLAHELQKRGLKVEREVPVPIIYDGICFDEGYRLDFLVEGQIVIEVKAVEKIHSVHEAQILTYLKLLNKKLGFLVNFNTKLISDGLKRVILSSAKS